MVDPDTKQALGEAMRALNVLACKQRYPDDTDESRPGKVGELTVKSYKYQHDLTTDVQGLRSLQSWLYQCAEGNAPTMPLYKAFEEVSHILALEIVYSLEAYEALTP